MRSMAEHLAAGLCVALALAFTRSPYYVTPGA